MNDSGIAQNDVPVEDALSAKAQKAASLYAGRVQIYPKDVSGLFRRLKWAALVVLLAIYYVVPWLRWDRGPDAPGQAVLIDMVNARGYFFFIEIWPQEVYYLAGLLIMGAFGIFLATSLAGRVWCGYACPQTVWTDLFMWVERHIEGDRNARIKLDAAPLTVGKAVKKAAKHTVWMLIALFTGGAWIMYFNDAPTVVVDIFSGRASTTVYGFTALFASTTYLLAGWAREQVCTYMCPWPRFQAAMFDEDTLIVTYEAWRGEPRGRHHKGESWNARGHCVDCNQCVAVCPTGVDIRDGVQMQCISCALCVDACNHVMDRLGLPGNLISYDTARNRANRTEGKPLGYRLIRPRTVLYGAVLALVGGVLLWHLATRSTLDINVLHDRNPLFVTLSNGDLRNGYTIKILNKSREARLFTLELEGLDGALMSVLGSEYDDTELGLLRADPDTVATYRIYVRAPRNRLTGDGMPIDFVLRDLERGEAAHHDSVFRGPTR